MGQGIWDSFMQDLVSKGKVDEFCMLPKERVNEWLESNEMAVSLEELRAFAPRVELSYAQLDGLAGCYYPDDPQWIAWWKSGQDLSKWRMGIA